MSDTPREEEIYQALAPGGSYKSGLVNPAVAQREEPPVQTMRFKGAMGGGAVGDDYPDHEPRTSVPYKHYKDLETVNPKLHEAVTTVADDMRIPRTDLASLVYANSDYDPNTRRGARTGYMGLTPDDARTIDPEGNLDINDPIDNLYMGAVKYKRLAKRFGEGSPNTFAAYHAGGDTTHSLLNRDPDEHRREAPDGTFDFLNKVLGRDGDEQADAGGGGDDQGGDLASMAQQAQTGAQPQRFTPSSGAVPPMVPNQPGAPPVSGDQIDQAIGFVQQKYPQIFNRIAQKIADSRGANPVSPYRSYEGPPEAARPGERGTYEGPPEGAPPRTGPLDTYEGPPEGAPPSLRTPPGAPYKGSLPSQVSPYRSYEGPPEAARPGERGTYEGPPEGAPPRTNLPPYYPQEISRPQGAGAGRQSDASQATQDILADRERIDRETPPPPGYYSRARTAIGEPNYGQSFLAVTDPDLAAGMGSVPGPAPAGYDADLLMGTTRDAQGRPASAPDSYEPPPRPREPVLTGAGGRLAPPNEPMGPPAPEGLPQTVGGYGVGGALRQTEFPPYDPAAAQAAGVAANPPATTGSGAPPAPPAAPVRQPAPGQAIGTDTMAADLNRRELARVQGNQPDVIPTGPTQAPQAPTPEVNPALADARINNPAGATAPAPVDQGSQRTIPEPAPAPTQGAPAQVSTEPGNYTAIGDSLAAHMIRNGGARGKEDRTKINSYREGDTAVSGWGTKAVLGLIEKIPLGQIQGQDVVLSTGASNSPDDLAAIPKQIARLKELGAKSVSVVGVGNRKDFAGVNDKLAKFVADYKDPKTRAADPSVVFAGALPNVGADNVHSTDPSSVLKSAQQALAKSSGSGAGTATTGSAAAPTPTTSPSAGGGGGATTTPATVGAGGSAPAPASVQRGPALAPPGSQATPSSAPPIDRLRGNTGAMTAVSVVRAGAEGGPDGVLTHFTRNGPRGMSVGDGWDHTQDLLERAFIMKGDSQGLMHAQEYIFNMKHKGAMENLMQAVGAMQDDPNAAAHFLARAHAFVTDGTQMGFQVINGKIYGQRYDEATHDKIGRAFEVTEAGVRAQAIANGPKKDFFTNLHNERTATETGRHNRISEKHQDETLKQQGEISERNFKERQMEFDIRRGEFQQQQARLEEQHKASLAQTKELALQRQHDLEVRQREAAAAADRAKAERAAETSAAHKRQVGEDLLEIEPEIKQTYTAPADAAKARRLYTAMRHEDAALDPNTAKDWMNNLMTGKFALHQTDADWVVIKDMTDTSTDPTGREMAKVPRSAVKAYLPSLAPGTQPNPAARPQPRARS